MENKMTTCRWQLENGQALEFTIFDFDSHWNQDPGLYIFAYHDGQFWRALYVGETSDFSSRLPSHELKDEVLRSGATHIHALLVPQRANRKQWEKMLIKYLDPPINRKHRPYPSVLPVFRSW